MKIPRRLAAAFIRSAELGRVPDPLLRTGIRRVVASRLTAERERDPEERRRFWREAWKGPVAVATGDANEQHYEVPPRFFELVLGRRLKYSSGWWPSPVARLDDAEESMLRLTGERALLADGQTILDLGCGWGSFSLWAAARYPSSHVVAVSNSAAQGRHIAAAAADRGIVNLRVVTADINDFDPGLRFDRIVSIEMLEHVRNHRRVFQRMRDWIEPDGLVFTHVFAHHAYAYPFETEGSGAWMARTFFTGGVMPSPELLPFAASPSFTTDATWWLDGTHYARTLEAWLDRLDARREDVRGVLEPLYGDDVDLCLQRWRMFFMACSELFSFDDGREWGVVHHRFQPVAAV